MKGVITSCAVIVVIVLIVEIFCPAKVMKKSLYMAFSLIMLVVIVSSIKNAFKNPSEGFYQNLSLKIESSSDSILSSSAQRTKNNIEKALLSAGINVVSIDMDYYIDEYKVIVNQVEVNIENEEDKVNALKIIKETTNLAEGDLKICATS